MPLRRARAPQNLGTAMLIDGKHMRGVWVEDDGWSIGIIDQTRLPHEFRTATLRSVADVARAIGDMLVRGAPLIGATGAYGMCLAAVEDPSDVSLDDAHGSVAEAIMASNPVRVM